ncbi:30S ribosomal protein S19e [Candidatus Woesearchaeota archaeon]|nr:30S ribosomal protein S19e [Candidatus Woesearchaeota archaeon]
MGNIFDVPINEFILKLAEELKTVDSIKSPEWSLFCKTGMHKERPPVQKDWWYVRAAAVLRAIKIKGPIGTQKLRIKYGGRKNRGYRPEHFYKGSGSIIRKVLQQLEKAGFVKKDEKGVHKGRIVTPDGDKLLNKVAISIMKESNIVIPKRPEEELRFTNVVKKKKKRKVKKRKKKAVKKKVVKNEVKKIMPEKEPESKEVKEEKKESLEKQSENKTQEESGK